MIFGYLTCIIMSIVAAALTYGLSLLELTLWQGIAIYGSVLPLYLFTTLVYLGGIGYVFKAFPAALKDEPTSDNGSPKKPARKAK